MRNDSQAVIWDDRRLAAPHVQPDKATRVRAMFDGIAPTYERVNRVLSLGLDASWRKKSVRLSNVQPTDDVLDLACGTGDFARAFATASPNSVTGSDFSAGMLAGAIARPSSIGWCQGDALHLPFPATRFDIVSCAFGVRNFQDLDAGLAEMYRVLRPNGRVCILEFTTPQSAFLGGLYRFYFHHILPRAAAIISGDRSGAYKYLPESVSTFKDERGMENALKAVGFVEVRHVSLTMGVAAVYLGVKQ